MEAIAAPAYLLNAGRIPVHANAAGRQAIDRNPHRARLALQEAVRAPDRQGGLSLTRVECGGATPYLLAIERAPVDTDARSVAAAARWALSPRQSRVLTWLVQGATNAHRRRARNLGPHRREPRRCDLCQSTGSDTLGAHGAGARAIVPARADAVVGFARRWSLGAHVMTAETSAARDPTCALSSIAATCDSTVRSDIPSSAPMRALLAP